MTTHLLDANVLIALVVSEHEHHGRASAWVAGVDRIALCPVVEGALVRFVVRVGGGAAVAQEILRRLRHDPRCDFWPDDVSYAEADLSDVRGHRQATDAYLVALAGAHPGAQLATMDTGLAAARPDLVVLIPPLPADR